MTVKNEKKRVMFTLSEIVIKSLDEMAVQRGLSKSAIVTLALEKLREEEKEVKK